jgi:uncharacterized protein (DUF305 family)
MRMFVFIGKQRSRDETYTSKYVQMVINHHKKAVNAFPAKLKL